MTPDKQSLVVRLEAMAVEREALAKRQKTNASFSLAEGSNNIARIEDELARAHEVIAADLRAAAKAVRASQWRPIAEAKQLGVERCIVGKRVRGWHWSQKETTFLYVAIQDGYTHYFIVPAPPEVGG